ncbi:hypothetical protein WICMUC_003012 [Wickerhamomyces mucosus]|uniref:RNA-binding protein n=1 Tax=Wickerhamomyces mucosus TaxID=1378264 RepID=A0A9P8TDK1_9ASCO|nr:hypothetical protein WICMUC_003012 [Wickerhamomyces mucosus]
MTDFYVALHISTTVDENNVYVTKDTSEVIEIAWNLISSSTLEILASDSTLIRPINTPITSTCTNLTGLSWDQVSNANSFKEGISKLDQFIHENIISKGLNFVFVTLDGWELRVGLPREAKDKNIVLPPYLQHSKSFFLRNEYSKWQSHHPETLSYGAANIGNILTALEIELTPPLSYSNIGSIPKRAANEVDILTKILVQLIKKSKPADDHPDVLTRPFDSKTDIRCFLSERSKVLYLSNLPNDTTQSELESWFTSHGGRPIAFWTLKTSDPHKPASSGFVVFSTHEEAAESLGINGRCLNDKPIEVQPSSARVLDRAQEILTPFPPSKNRPRPGDWTCPSCGFSNFQRRTACFRCSFPAASAVAIKEQIQPSYNPQQQQQQQQQQQPQTINQQQQHHHQHDHQHQHQQIQNQSQHHQHQHQHQQQQQQQPQQPQQKHQQHLTQPQQISNKKLNQLNSGNSNNSNGSTNNNNGQGNRSVPFRAGDWKCLNENCQYHNFAKNITCLRCGAPRTLDFSQTQIQGSQLQNQKQSQLNQIPLNQFNNNNNSVNVSNGFGIENQEQLKLNNLAFTHS